MKNENVGMSSTVIGKGVSLNEPAWDGLKRLLRGGQERAKGEAGCTDEGRGYNGK